MKLFISYRREDSAGHTGRLYDSLRGQIGDDNIFLDLSGIDSGQNFVDVIQTAIRSSDVVLAIIGNEWLTCTANGRRRLDDPNDFVRTEIVAALGQQIPIIPVLVNKAPPPPAGSLPDALRPLARIDAHELSDERWAYDVDRLLAAIKKLAHARRHQATGRYIAIGAGVAIVALLLGVWAWRSGFASRDETRATTQAVSAAVSAFAGEWAADVTYEWGAKYTEPMTFTVDGDAVIGTASFLGVPRGIVNGRVEGDRLVFETHTQEVTGDQSRDVVHRYRGRAEGDAIAFTMQSEGGSSQLPVQFTARRR